MAYPGPVVPRCAVIVGMRFADGGRPCGHALNEHERHEDEAFVYYVCRPCRAIGVPWAPALPIGVAGADHTYSGPRLTQ